MFEEYIHYIHHWFKSLTINKLNHVCMHSIIHTSYILPPLLLCMENALYDENLYSKSAVTTSPLIFYLAIAVSKEFPQLFEFQHNKEFLCDTQL